MDARILFLLSFLFGLIGFSIIARWYARPLLGAAPREEALSALVLPHVFRYLGLAFLMPGVTSESLADAFAVPAAYGDLLAAVLALITLLALRFRWAAALPLTWVFNVVGTADLLLAVSLGLRFAPPTALGAAYFIPAVLVPGLLVTHLLVFGLLLRRNAPVHGTAVGSPSLNVHGTSTSPHVVGTHPRGGAQ